MIAAASKLGPFKSHPSLDDSAQARCYRTCAGSGGKNKARPRMLGGAAGGLDWPFGWARWAVVTLSP